MAAWALTQPGGTLPPGVSKANVDFYRSHEQALKKLRPGRVPTIATVGTKGTGGR